MAESMAGALWWQELPRSGYGSCFYDLITGKATELYRRLSKPAIMNPFTLQLLPDERVAVVNRLREISEGYWNPSRRIQRVNGPADMNAVESVAFKIHLELVGWQSLQNMHEAVIGELELLVGESAVTHAATR